MRNPVTNATPHVGYQYTVSFDLTDFFDTVRWHHVGGVLSGASAVPQCEIFRDGAPRQGLPTSPLVANIAASLNIDSWIMPLIEGRDIRYTRYVDDLTFSTNDLEMVKWLLVTIPPLIASTGFKVNRKKTRVQWAGAGRRIITGIAVDDKGVYATRAVRRKLRAAQHQGNADSIRGLEEWCKMKLPAKGLLTKRAYNKAHKIAATEIPKDAAIGWPAYYAAMDEAKQIEREVRGESVAE
jgi:hypothetical protein